MEHLETQVQQLVDDRLIDVYQQSVKHYGNTDLVLVFDESRAVDPVDFYERTKLVESPDMPESLKTKLSKPANEAAGSLQYSEVAFWLVVSFSNEEMACTAIKATLLGPHGNA